MYFKDDNLEFHQKYKFLFFCLSKLMFKQLKSEKQNIFGKHEISKLSFKKTIIKIN